VRRLLYTAVLLVASAHLAAMPAGGPRLVLCLGADGHVALEHAADGASCSTPVLPAKAAEPAAPPAVHADGDSHCGACVDMPLAPAACPAQTGPASKPVAPTMVAVASAVEDGAAAQARLAPSPVATANPDIMPLTQPSTVLLI